MKRTNTARKAFFTSVISLLLCVSMLVGTTFAWFTDSVTSANNIIKSGTLDVEMYYGDAANAITNDASEGAIFNYDLWEPGYTMAKYVQVKNVGNLAFEFRLDIVPVVAAAAGETNLADVIDVYMFDATATVNRDAVAAATPVGTLSELMADTDGAAHGILLPAEGVGSNDYNVAVDTPRGDITYCIVLKMQESAGNEYQDLSVGGGFKVQLLATQYTWENDSFDHEYDDAAEYKAEANAIVNPIPEEELVGIQVPLYTYSAFSNTGNVQIGLEKGFTFTAAQDEEEAQNSEYATWHADFVVTFDQPIATGTAGLAGQYDFWGLDWVGFEAFDTHNDGYDGIPANTPCRLLEGKGVYVDYTQLCRDIQSFNCGVFNKDDANKGTTINVELRLYETNPIHHDEHTDYNGNYCNGDTANCETGHYVSVGTYTYTFK